ncbi:3-phenylpropionate/trans-cinnamate dioxygenase ferredoxin reductase subunit [Aurantimicrobium minutum]|uniref:NAD(P)/FAD-dependent oxidoreductase n=1 Tax=Aurantimicrobium minutum TaxID=708131 RepID=UPI0024742259|nr:NAD(P)/FAD-dependent oxidoreductase [Aurantimicrobium minutum]MDH6424129.1 3-phenylpropionate/trans-cinnamate dioxygenase ferredoxin reductase subunit [Aurantimicrobium minutum]
MRKRKYEKQLKIALSVQFCCAKATTNKLRKYELVVVGASVAAEALTTELGEMDFEGKVLVVERDPRMPYERPPLSKKYLSSNGEIDITVDWELDIELVIANATKIDCNKKQLEFETVAENKTDTVAFDKLVIATGATPFHLPLEPEGVLSLRTIDDSELIRTSAQATGSVGIIGAGAIGVELATSLREIGVKVTLFDKAAAPLERLLAGHLGDTVTTWLQDLGVTCEFNADLVEISRTSDQWVISLGDGRALSFGTLVSAVGARPTVQWLNSSNLLTDGQLVCDGLGRVITPMGLIDFVYAAGDVVTRKSDSGDYFRTESWTAAAEQGKHLAEFISGTEISENEEPYFWTDVAGRKVQVLGRLHPDAKLEKITEDPERKATLFKATASDGTVGWIGINSPQGIAKLRMGLQD